MPVPSPFRPKPEPLLFLDLEISSVISYLVEHVIITYLNPFNQ